MSTNGYTDEECLEMLDQQITLTLQEIDSNFVKAHEKAAGLVGQVRTFHAHTKEVHANLQVWNDFFNCFHQVGLTEQTKTEMRNKFAAEYGQELIESQEGMDQQQTPKAQSGELGSSPTGSGMSTPSLGSEPRTTPFRRIQGFHSSAKGQPSSSAVSPFTPGNELSRKMRFSSVGVDENMDGDDENANGDQSSLPSTPVMKSPPRSTQLLKPNKSLNVQPEDAKQLFVAKKDEDSQLDEHDEQEDNEEDQGPQFDLSMFPTVFQEGVGALQITELYSQFFGDQQMEAKNIKPSLSMTQLKDLLPEYEEDRLLLLLDTLSSRSLLKQIFVNDDIYWQAQASASTV